MTYNYYDANRGVTQKQYPKYHINPEMLSRYKAKSLEHKK